MKKKISILSIVFAIVVIMLSGCSYTVDSVAGSWNCTKDSVHNPSWVDTEFTFKADGTCSLGGWASTDYSVNGGEITWKGEKYSLYINGSKMTWSNFVLGTMEFEKL